MTLAVLLFVLVAAVTVGSAAAVVVTADVVRAAVWLLLTLVGVALLYLLLGAGFVAAAHLVVYVGGIMVLVVFALMLTGAGPRATLRARPAEWAAAGVLTAGLFGTLAAVAVGIDPPPASADRELPGAGRLGLALLGETATTPAEPVTADVPRTPVAYLLPFEVLSVHLLVVLIGAAYLARAKRRVKP